jgi:hypothetical protein
MGEICNKGARGCDLSEMTIIFPSVLIVHVLYAAAGSWLWFSHCWHLVLEVPTYIHL